MRWRNRPLASFQTFRTTFLPSTSLPPVGGPSNLCAWQWLLCLPSISLMPPKAAFTWCAADSRLAVICACRAGAMWAPPGLSREAWQKATDYFLADYIPIGHTPPTRKNLRTKVEKLVSTFEVRATQVIPCGRVHHSDLELQEDHPEVIAACRQKAARIFAQQPRDDDDYDDRDDDDHYQLATLDLAFEHLFVKKELFALYSEKESQEMRAGLSERARITARLAAKRLLEGSTETGPNKRPRLDGSLLATMESQAEAREPAAVARIVEAARTEVVVAARSDAVAVARIEAQASLAKMESMIAFGDRVLATVLMVANQYYRNQQQYRDEELALAMLAGRPTTIDVSRSIDGGSASE